MIEELNVIKLDTKEGVESYQSLISSLEIFEPYFLKEYIDIFSDGTSNLVCFSYLLNENKDYIVMPGYLNQIIIGNEKTTYYDFITPYGYTGPIYSKNLAQSHIEDFWRLLDNWYNLNNVITEFIRFNLFGNHEYYSGKIVTTLLNVKGNIIEEESQWKAFNNKVRKNVKKAQREKLSSKIYFLNITDENLNEFYDIYIQTMIRSNASERFLYSFDEFKIFLKNNEEYCAICTVYFQNIPISSELLLISEETIYSFLGGTDSSYFDKRPNDFLKVEALNWARKNDKKYYVLGGGYGLEDGIFKYKKNFFPNDVVNYYTGRKILNKIVYNELVEKVSNLRLLNGLDKLKLDDNTFFPLYHKIN